MLGKLMKFDLKSSYRAFVGIYAAIFLMAVLLGTTIRLQNEWLFVFVPLALMAVVIASAVIAFLGILKLFNDSVYPAQGYLTLSLPVRAEAVVASKCLVALIWLLLLLLVGAASVAVCLLIGVPQDFWREFSQEAVYAMRYLRANIWQFGSFPWALGALMLVSAVESVLMLYLAVAVANLRQLRRHKIIAGVVAYFVIGQAQSIAMGLIGAAIYGVPMLRGSIVPTAQMETFALIRGPFSAYLWIALAFSLALGTGAFFLISWLMRRHLELE